MLKAGITGGIGSGKSTVCQVFETLGIPVFYADAAAKFLMQEDESLRAGIINLFGADAYTEGLLNRAYISSVVFKDQAKLAELNALTHPAVIRYGAEWMNSRNSPYVLKEAALFFETGSYTQMDVMIGVSAPQSTRIKRTMEREGITAEQVQQRIDRQMNEDEKMSRCDYVIVNDELQSVIDQVLELHHVLLQKAG